MEALQRKSILLPFQPGHPRKKRAKIKIAKSAAYAESFLFHESERIKTKTRAKIEIEIVAQIGTDETVADPP